MNEAMLRLCFEFSFYATIVNEFRLVALKSGDGTQYKRPFRISC